MPLDRRYRAMMLWLLEAASIILPLSIFATASFAARNVVR